MIAALQSGKPFSIVNSGNGVDATISPYNGQTESYGNRATPQNNGGNDCPNLVGNPHLAHKTLSEFFNTAAFAPQPVGTIGTAKRNSLFGPHFRNFDVSLVKTFPLTQKLDLQFRVEAFDVTNTPNWFINNNGGNGSTQLGNAAFGTFAGTDPHYVPRELQF